MFSGNEQQKSQAVTHIWENNNRKSSSLWFFNSCRNAVDVIICFCSAKSAEKLQLSKP